MKRKTTFKDSLKPIETSYNNYLFRSRTEARWGVWLDAMGFEWEYEYQGYNLGNAGFYLPDFVVRIPEEKEDDGFPLSIYVFEKEFYLEIKPGNSFCFDKKHAALSKESGKEVVCAFGVPNIIESPPEDFGERDMYEYKYGLYLYKDGELIMPYYSEDNKKSENIFALGSNEVLYISGLGEKYNLILGEDDYHELPNILDERLKYAYKKAMSARFEFGENG